MAAPADRLAPRLARHAAASVVAWAAAVGAALWYLRRAQPADVRALPLTHPDSIGLPLVAFALLAAGVLVAANAIAAVLLARRRRTVRRPTADSPSRHTSDDAS